MFYNYHTDKLFLLKKLYEEAFDASSWFGPRRKLLVLELVLVHSVHLKTSLVYMCNSQSLLLGIIRNGLVVGLKR